MARTARVVVAAVPHHVTQRGNNRNPIFHSDSDRARYLAILGEQGRMYRLAILGYCLMPNHVHLVVVPEEEATFAQALGRTSQYYTHFHHTRYGGCGHLWQQRPWSCPMDPSYTIAALVYTELNPVRARLARTPGGYLWSSARAHLESRDRTGLLDMQWWRQSKLAADWRERLAAGVERSMIDRLHKAASAGAPCGSDAFVERIKNR